MISSILSSIMLCELRDFGIGSHMGGPNAVTFRFADDLNGLAASMYALTKMINICVNYAAKCDIIYNEKYAKLLYFILGYSYY